MNAVPLADAEPGSPGVSASLPLGTGVTARVLQTSETSCKFVIPKEVGYIFWIHAGSSQILVNQPRLRWWLPLPLEPELVENEAVPGAGMEIVGRNFLLDPDDVGKVRVVLRAESGSVWPLILKKVEPYCIAAVLPEQLAPGSYSLWIHNGHGGPEGWGGPLFVSVRSKTTWPSKVWNVKDFGAKGDNISDDITPVRAALLAAEKGGGGIIYFPRGVYRLSLSLTVPKKVTLRGEGREVTILEWPQTNPTSPRDYLVAALCGAGEFGIENLSIVVRKARYALLDLSFFSSFALGSSNALDKLPPEARERVERFGEGRDIFLRKVRIDYIPLCGRAGSDPTREAQWEIGHWGIENTTTEWLAVAMDGVRNVELSNCEIQGEIRMLDLQGGRIEDSVFANGMGVGWVDLGGCRLIVEGNRLDCASSLRGAHIPITEAYIAHNSSSVVQHGEREALTLDGWTGILSRDWPAKADAWIGKAAWASERELGLTDANLNPGYYVGMDVQVLTGRGALQVRKIAQNQRNQLVVDRPWDVTPDSTSLVLIQQLYRDIVFYANTARDASSLAEIWGFAYDVVVAKNVAERTQGIWTLGGWLIEWLGNRVENAVTYHEGTGPAAEGQERDPEGGVPFGFVGGVTSDPPWALKAGVWEHLRGVVARGNTLVNGNRFLFRKGYVPAECAREGKTIRDVIVEGNRIEGSRVGVQLEGVQDVVVRGNRYADVSRAVWTQGSEGVEIDNPGSADWRKVPGKEMGADKHRLAPFLFGWREQPPRDAFLSSQQQ